jgi:Tol biopolymer transport system component
VDCGGATSHNAPDGKQVVYILRRRWVRKKEGMTVSIWMARVGEENSAKQLTSGYSNDTSVQYSPDGRYISFISDRHSTGKTSVTYLLPVGTGEALALTKGE